jgi:hypothetical protein
MKCKNIECINELVKKVYCSLTCRNYYVNKNLHQRLYKTKESLKNSYIDKYKLKEVFIRDLYNYNI